MIHNLLFNFQGRVPRHMWKFVSFRKTFIFLKFPIAFLYQAGDQKKKNVAKKLKSVLDWPRRATDLLALFHQPWHWAYYGNPITCFTIRTCIIRMCGLFFTTTRVKGDRKQRTNRKLVNAISKHIGQGTTIKKQPSGLGSSALYQTSDNGIEVWVTEDDCTIWIFDPVKPLTKALTQK